MFLLVLLRKLILFVFWEWHLVPRWHVSLIYVWLQPLLLRSFVSRDKLGGYVRTRSCVSGTLWTFFFLLGVLLHCLKVFSWCPSPSAGPYCETGLFLAWWWFFSVIFDIGGMGVTFVCFARLLIKLIILSDFFFQKVLFHGVVLGLAWFGMPIRLRRFDVGRTIQFSHLFIRNFWVLRSHKKGCFFSFILCIFRCRIRIWSPFWSLASSFWVIKIMY